MVFGSRGAKCAQREGTVLYKNSDCLCLTFPSSHSQISAGPSPDTSRGRWVGAAAWVQGLMEGAENPMP